jgi:uncharacterized protein (DUF58 family)
VTGRPARRGVADVWGRVRTPAEPGPGPLSSASLRALDLAIARRLDGLLAGDYRSAFTGIGTELYQVRRYAPGDDVRRIDWNVTARTGEPHVRVELADRVLATWMVVDLSASMAYGTSDRRKADVAEGVSIAVGHLATRRGNRLGAVVFGPGEPRFFSPRQGRRGLLLALDAIRAAPAGSGRLEEALRLVELFAVQKSLVIVVSDFQGPSDWRQLLARLAERHRILAVEVRDPREQEVTDIGELRMEDPETGRQLLVDTSDPRVRARFAELAAEERLALATMLASAGVQHVVLSTEGDWLRPLAAFLRRGDLR